MAVELTTAVESMTRAEAQSTVYESTMIAKPESTPESTTTLPVGTSSSTSLISKVVCNDSEDIDLDGSSRPNSILAVSLSKSEYSDMQTYSEDLANNQDLMVGITWALKSEHMGQFCI